MVPGTFFCLSMRPSPLESWMNWLPITTGHARTVALGEACDSGE